MIGNGSRFSRHCNRGNGETSGRRRQRSGLVDDRRRSWISRIGSRRWLGKRGYLSNSGWLGDRHLVCNSRLLGCIRLLINRGLQNNYREFALSPWSGGNRQLRNQWSLENRRWLRGNCWLRNSRALNNGPLLGDSDLLNDRRFLENRRLLYNNSGLTSRWLLNNSRVRRGIRGLLSRDWQFGSCGAGRARLGWSPGRLLLGLEAGIGLASPIESLLIDGADGRRLGGGASSARAGGRKVRGRASQGDG